MVPQVIVQKMIDYLRNVSDEVIKADVVQRIGELVERFAPDTQWFIDTMNQVPSPNSPPEGRAVKGVCAPHGGQRRSSCCLRPSGGFAPG